MTALLTQMNGMVTTGNELISATESLSASLQTGIATPVANIAAALTGMETQLNAINTQLGTLQSDCETAVADVNAKITDYNTKVDAAQAAANTSKTQIANAISALQVQLNATTDESVRDQISTAITALQNAQTAADGLNNVQKASAITVSVPTFDLSAITSGAATLQTNLKTFKETAAALQQQLPGNAEETGCYCSSKGQSSVRFNQPAYSICDSVESGNAGTEYRTWNSFRRTWTVEYICSGTVPDSNPGNY